jgi:hypothetical protein
MNPEIIFVMSNGNAGSELTSSWMWLMLKREAVASS